MAIPTGPVPTIDFATLVRTARPNQYLLAPAGLCTTTVDAESPVFPRPVTALEAAWQRIAAAEPRLEPVRAEVALRQYDYVARSAVLGFPDLVTVRFLAQAPDRSTLAVYSRSVFGRWDIGANRRRVRRWLAAFSSSIRDGA
ncbi:MAG: DUF1499 domain-containing protein [Alphaproteobacteria bacterium]|nr:DUF1499 domain-containing protein [Alphaproteobacteria bacterium]